MGYRSAPATARTSDVFPDPGAPWRRYPRRHGIPRSAYHRSRRVNARASATISAADAGAEAEPEGPEGVVVAVEGGSGASSLPASPALRRRSGSRKITESTGRAGFRPASTHVIARGYPTASRDPPAPTEGSDPPDALGDPPSRPSRDAPPPRSTPPHPARDPDPNPSTNPTPPPPSVVALEGDVHLRPPPRDPSRPGAPRSQRVPRGEDLAHGARRGAARRREDAEPDRAPAVAQARVAARRGGGAAESGRERGGRRVERVVAERIGIAAGRIAEETAEPGVREAPVAARAGEEGGVRRPARAAAAHGPQGGRRRPRARARGGGGRGGGRTRRRRRGRRRRGSRRGRAAPTRARTRRARGRSCGHEGASGPCEGRARGGPIRRRTRRREGIRRRRDPRRRRWYWYSCRARRAGRRRGDAPRA